MPDVSSPHISPYKAGEVLDGWIIESALGAGGMGVVYQATHERSGLLAAIKILPGAEAAGGEILQRFRREVKALARIRHASVVNILQEALDHDPPYFAMELLPGGSLAARIDSIAAPGGKPPGAAFLTQLARQLADGLQAIHAENIVHRDIKPQNVLFADDDHAKFADFGMAKALDLTGLTVANRVMGTLPYMAPEALRGQPADRRTDFYQLGVTLYEAATGKRPYAGEDLVGVLAGRPLPPLPRLAEQGSQAPAWYQAMLDRLTAFRPEDRYESAAEILEDLERSRVAPRRHRSHDVTTVSISQPTAVPPLARSRPSVSNPVLSRILESGPQLQRTTGQLGSLARAASRSAWFFPSLVLFVFACALIAWRLNRSSEYTPSPPPPARAVTPAAPVPARRPATAALPDKPVILELPDALLMFGAGKPPELSSRAGTAGAPRLAVSDGLWQVGLSTASPPSPADRMKLATLFAKLPDALAMRLGSSPLSRFGDELKIRESNPLEGQFYPGLRGTVPTRLGMGRGRLVMVEVPSDDFIHTLIGERKGPPWLELQILDRTVPRDMPAFEARLARAVRLMEPCLSVVGAGRALNADGWRDSPQALGGFVDRLRRVLGGMYPTVAFAPGSLALEGQGLPESARLFLSLPQFRSSPQIELHVTDVGSGWLDGMMAFRRAALAMGIRDTPIDVCLSRLPRTSPRYASRSFAGDDVEMRELLRATTLAVGAGARRIWFAALRETLQGPILMDIFHASIDGKVVEREGSGARAFRYALSRLGEARPARQPLPGGVQGAALELPGRKVWFLWAPDGAQRLVQVPASSSVVLVVRLCPVAAWNNPGEPPVQVRPVRDGLVPVVVDDGLVAVEELAGLSGRSR